MLTAPDNLSPRRRKARDRRRDAILTAAMDIVNEGGLDALTMGRLAEVVELTPGALYRYFASKDALMAALQARNVSHIAALLDDERSAWREDLPSSPEAAALCDLLGCAMFYIDLPERDPRAFRLVAVTLGEPRPLVDDENATLVVAPLRELILYVSALFEEAAARGALSPGDAPLRTIVFWTSLHGVVSSHKLNRLADSAGWFAPSRLAGELVTSLFAGWGARPETMIEARRWQARRAIKSARRPT